MLEVLDVKVELNRETFEPKLKVLVEFPLTMELQTDGKQIAAMKLGLALIEKLSAKMEQMDKDDDHTV